MLQIANVPPLDRLVNVRPGPRARIEVTVMVACNHDLVFVGEGGERIDLGLDLGDGAGVGEVAGVDEDIPGGHRGEDLRVGV